MIDYQEIIENLNEDKVIELFEKLDIPYVNKDTYIMCKTACHNIDLDEASWKLYYYKDNHFFYCYTSCQGMSIFTFLKKYYEVRGIDYDWYEDIYKLIIDCSSYKKHNIYNVYKPVRENYSKNNFAGLPSYPKGILDIFVKIPIADWIKEGISENTLKKFNIRYSISQNKIIIPHYDINGELVGIRGRALDEWEIENVGKYMPVQIEGKWYSHPLSLNLYGLNLNKENIKKEKICYIFEAEKSVMLSEELSSPNCSVAICGSNLNKYAIKQLVFECHPQEIVICFDKEEKEGEDKYFNKIYNLCSKYRNYAKMSFIYDRKNLLNMKDAPIDKGEDIFRQLIKERVKV